MDPQVQALINWCEDPANAHHRFKGATVGSISGRICGIVVLTFGDVIPSNYERVQEAVAAGERVLVLRPMSCFPRVIRQLLASLEA